MINAYLVDSITLVRDAGNDKWGEPNTVTTESVKGYIEWGTFLVRDINGEEVTSSGFAFLAYDATIDHKDKLKIDSVEYSIIRIERQKDFANRGLKVFFK